MLLQVPQPATNGQDALPASKLARTQRQLRRDNAAMAVAKFAVLGYCQPAGSYSSLGVNLVSDVLATQSLLKAAMSTAAPGASRDGAGGYTAQDTTTGPTVFPMGQGGLPAPPVYPSLTTAQGPGVPVVPVSNSVMGGSPACSRGQSVQSVPPTGAAWGNASATHVPAMLQGLKISKAGWLAIGALALLAVGTRGGR